jgi:Leucine-rich repeat (LRR) protein
MQKMKNLRTLDLYDNQISVYPGVLALLPLLKNKDLGIEVSILSSEIETTSETIQIS